MASCNLDRGFLMVAGDSVLGFKGKKEKIFADNAVGEIFEARNHSPKYTYTSFFLKKQYAMRGHAHSTSISNREK